MTGWPVEIDGREYSPIPESWIDHGDDLEAGSPRLYAVSACVEDHSKRLHVRYAHPVEEAALSTTTTSVEHGDGLVPFALAKRGHRWPRSLVPASHVGPSGVLRGPEIDYFRELWADRLDDVEPEFATDGGGGR